MSHTKNCSSFISILALFMIFVFSGSVFAAAECKGLVKNKCAEQKQCSWVNAYKRSDGAEVKGYCRSKSTNKTSQNSSKSNKSTKGQLLSTSKNTK